MRAPLDLVLQTKDLGRLPVVNFAAGGGECGEDKGLALAVECMFFPPEEELLGHISTQFWRCLCMGNCMLPGCPWGTVDGAWEGTHSGAGVGAPRRSLQVTAWA